MLYGDLYIWFFDSSGSLWVGAEDEREFSYEEGSPNGPDHWGEIHEDWATCNNGDMQSPIDLTHERVEIVPGLGRLKRSYKASNATLKNRGHDIMVQPFTCLLATN